MVDHYTKVVLTVIAGALLALVVQNAVRTASAQGGEIQKVQICDSQNCADLSPITRVSSRGFETTWGLKVAPPQEIQKVEICDSAQNCAPVDFGSGLAVVPHRGP
jgi:hypothetical protein